jgi:thiamine-phosphate diphosphorylase
MLVTEPVPELTRIVAEAVAAGVDIVQWRDKTSDKRETLDMAGAMRAAAAHALLVVNGDAGLARACRADGLHLGEQGGAVADMRARMTDAALIGRSVHSVEAAAVAERTGADFLIAGTIFSSRSHPGLEPAGIDFLRKVCAAVTIPVIAIGGITPENAGDCLAAGAAGVAVLSPIMRAASPREAVQAYRAALFLQ